MRLARVEYYFAKFLSAMEIRARNGAATIELGAQKVLTLYPNLFFIGTINVDETTHDFLEAPLENLPFLYQIWGTLEVLMILLEVTGNLGYQVKHQNYMVRLKTQGRKARYREEYRRRHNDQKRIRSLQYQRRRVYKKEKEAKQGGKGHG